MQSVRTYQQIAQRQLRLSLDDLKIFYRMIKMFSLDKGQPFADASEVLANMYLEYIKNVVNQKIAWPSIKTKILINRFDLLMKSKMQVACFDIDVLLIIRSDIKNNGKQLLSLGVSTDEILDVFQVIDAECKDRMRSLKLFIEEDTFDIRDNMLAARYLKVAIDNEYNSLKYNEAKTAGFSSKLVRTYTQLGVQLQYIGSNHKAIQYLSYAIIESKKIPVRLQTDTLKTDVSSARRNLAMLNAQVGHSYRSYDYYEKAVEFYRAAFVNVNKIPVQTENDKKNRELYRIVLILCLFKINVKDYKDALKNNNFAIKLIDGAPEKIKSSLIKDNILRKLYVINKNLADQHLSKKKYEQAKNRLNSARGCLVRVSKETPLDKDCLLQLRNSSAKLEHIQGIYNNPSLLFKTLPPALFSPVTALIKPSSSDSYKSNPSPMTKK